MRMLPSFVLLAAVLPAQPAGDVSTRAVVERAAFYVKAYQEQLTSVLADERYTQQLVQQVPFDHKMPRTRTLTSELFFMFAPAGDAWMAIRDVVEVDGRVVDARPDLREALRLLPAREVARKFKDYNSRFNLGRTYRNFNEPTLSLLVLDAEHRGRFSFDRRKVEGRGDAALVTLAFTEKERPTLIRDLNHGSVFSKGELTVEAQTGRIRRAVLTATIGPVKLLLTTTYAHDGRLGMWVPASFREQYEYGVAANDAKERLTSGQEYEHILCEAIYTNYRRFETSVRIK